MLNAVFVLQNIRPKRNGNTDFMYVDDGIGSLFLGLCQNSEVMRTVQF
jgi:hypothetical protein